MSVYVDHQQRIFQGMLMSHMVADSSEELLAMADAIGVQRRWIQKAGTAEEHFDIADSKRTLAIAKGAIAVTSREIVAVIQRKRRVGAFPRRRTVSQWSPEERAVHEALIAVETRDRLHPHMRAAALLLAEAQDAVADYVDGVPAESAPIAAGGRGDWGCTYTGLQFYPQDPRPEEICIEDIAHALSNLCRFAGHCREFYSVAQHSVLVSENCAPADALAGLLHDAPEAYIVDVPRPLKYAAGMEAYRALEARYNQVVADRFGLPTLVPPSVKRADDVLLATEARDLMPPASVSRWCLAEAPASWIQIVPLPPREAEQLFLEQYRELAEVG